MSDGTPEGLAELFAGLDVDPALLQDALKHADEHATVELPEDREEGTPGAPEPRGLGGEVWIAEAEDLSSHTGSYRGGGLMEGGPPRVVWHTTEAPSGGGYFDAMDRVLTSKTAWSTVLYDPLTDRLGQYFPLNRSARALADLAGGVRTNRCGSVCIQIEVVAYASKPFTAYWKPGRNFAALMRAIRSWGVPDKFTQPQMPYPGPATDRSTSTWLNVAGHRSHQNVPENDHGDAGAIDTAAILAIGSTPPPQEDDLPYSEAQLARIINDSVINVLRSTEARLMRAWESGGQPSVPIIMCSTDPEGGKIYSLMPGQPKHWLTPEEWDLLKRLYPQLNWLIDPARPYSGRFLESEIDKVWALLQPEHTSASPPFEG